MESPFLKRLHLCCQGRRRLLLASVVGICVSRGWQALPSAGSAEVPESNLTSERDVCSSSLGSVKASARAVTSPFFLPVAFSFSSGDEAGLFESASPEDLRLRSSSPWNASVPFRPAFAPSVRAPPSGPCSVSPCVHNPSLPPIPPLAPSSASSNTSAVSRQCTARGLSPDGPCRLCGADGTRPRGLLRLVPAPPNIEFRPASTSSNGPELAVSETGSSLELRASCLSGRSPSREEKAPEEPSVTVSLLSLPRGDWAAPPPARGLPSSSPRPHLCPENALAASCSPLSFRRGGREPGGPAKDREP